MHSLGLSIPKIRIYGRGALWLVTLGLTFGSASCGSRPNESPSGTTRVEAASPEASDLTGAEIAGPPEVGGVPPMPSAEVRSEVPEVRVEEVARDLEIPWDIAFAPDGRMFFTERPGRIRVMRSGQSPSIYLNLQQVVHRGEGGLMGLALHPEFANQPYLYVMYTAQAAGGPVNRVSRFRDTGQTAGDEEILIDDIPAAQFHDGGVLDFGPDGMLYAGTGDARNPASAQDRRSLAGKILRVTPEGKVPGDNPFPNSPVWAYGFRNVTALAWHPGTRELWAANHGPSGEFGLRAKDAVYIVRKGGNHGWPVVVGTTDRPGLVSPVLYYPDEAVPPGGSLFYTGERLPQFRGDYFLATLRSTHLQRVGVEGDRRITEIERWWPDRYGRLRAVVQGPDGAIYFSTSNEDGRARRSYPGSDFIYRIVPVS